MRDRASARTLRRRHFNSSPTKRGACLDAAYRLQGNSPQTLQASPPRRKSLAYDQLLPYPSASESRPGEALVRAAAPSSADSLEMATAHQPCCCPTRHLLEKVQQGARCCCDCCCSGDWLDLYRRFLLVFHLLVHQRRCRGGRYWRPADKKPIFSAFHLQPLVPAIVVRTCRAEPCCYCALLAAAPPLSESAA